MSVTWRTCPQRTRNMPLAATFVGVHFAQTTLGAASTSGGTLYDMPSEDRCQNHSEQVELPITGDNMQSTQFNTVLDIHTVDETTQAQARTLIFSGLGEHFGYINNVWFG